LNRNGVNGPSWQQGGPRGPPTPGPNGHMSPSMSPGMSPNGGYPNSPYPPPGGYPTPPGSYRGGPPRPGLLKGETNFALSLSSRKTFIPKDGNLHGIRESDPWQEEIKKNYEEFVEKSRKRSNRNHLFKFMNYDDYMNDFPDSE